MLVSLALHRALESLLDVDRVVIVPAGFPFSVDSLEYQYLIMLTAVLMSLMFTGESSSFIIDDYNIIYRDIIFKSWTNCATRQINLFKRLRLP